MRMIVMRHIHIHDGQHHKDERLQGDNKDMENCPHELQGATDQYPGRNTAEHDRDKNKNHFAGVHIAE